MKKLGLLLTVLCLSLFIAVAAQAGTAGVTASVVLEENQTTGYGWTYAANPEGIVREVSSVFVQDPGPENIMGPWGKRTWLFEGTAQGDTLLRFTYARPSEPNIAPARVVSFLFRVDGMLNAVLRGSAEASGSYVFISLAENPTTGYQWVLAPSVEGVLNQESDEFLQEASAEGMVGAGGTRIWRFAAAKAGEVTLNFSLQRSFEPGAADQLRLTFTIDTGLNAALKAIE